MPAHGFSSISSQNQGLLKSFQLHLKVERLSPNTITNYMVVAGKLAEWAGERDLQSLTSADLKEHWLELQATLSTKSVRERQVGARRFYAFLLEEEEVQKNPAASTKLQRFDVTAQPSYSVNDIKRMLLACDSKTKSGVRNRALILVVVDTGMRVGEACSMTVADTNLERNYFNTVTMT